MSHAVMNLPFLELMHWYVKKDPTGSLLYEMFTICFLFKQLYRLICVVFVMNGYPELDLNLPGQPKQNNIIKIYKKIHWL